MIPPDPVTFFTRRARRARAGKADGRDPEGPRPSQVELRSAGPARLALVVDRATGVVEDPVEHATEGEDHDDDQRRDAGDEQAVLDRGRTALFTRRVPPDPFGRELG